MLDKWNKEEIMPKKTYEYKLFKKVASSQITETKLNTQGANGWKLVFLERNDDDTWNAIFIRE